MSCIFLVKPVYCSGCLESMKLQCLINHTHTIVSEEGKKDLSGILEAEMKHARRVKHNSGQEERR